MADVDLDAVLVAARRGDEVAIGRLFRALQPQLLRYLARQAPGEADDLASETWHAAAKLLREFTGSAGDFRALLFTIARRRVVDHHRRQSRRVASAPLDETAPVGAGGDPAELVVASLSTEQAIEALVGSLSADQAEVVLLRVVAGLSVDEVAKVMERTPGSVRVLQHRALQRLARQLDPGGVTG